MAESFFFYDLETSGTNPREDRIMQFAGQRTDLELNVIGDPINVLVKMGEDVLPQPDAILVTGITPQMTLADGITETEFFKMFSEEIVQNGTIFVGFNNVRFDDEFMRYGFYRNFYDAYQWQWDKDCSRWDILDLSRLTRALRPEGIEWPFAPDGKPSNRLELLTAVNGLDHVDAHDALSDVRATIAIAGLIRQHQPKLFDYMLSMRGKKAVEKLVNSQKPFVYVSGKYSSEYEKLTVVSNLGKHPDKGDSFVYDLRHDPSQYLDMTVEELVEAWRWKEDKDAVRLPVKVLRYNRCPAIAPMTVLRDQDYERLKLDKLIIAKHAEILAKDAEFYQKIVDAVAIIDTEYKQTALVKDEKNVDGELYDGFIADSDKPVMREVRSADPTEIAEFITKLHDPRLKALLPLYKARNYPEHLTDEEHSSWEQFRSAKIHKALPGFVKRLQELSVSEDVTDKQHELLQELQLYAESIFPES